MKKRLEENDEALIRIKKTEVSEEQIIAHWNLVLAKIKPYAQEKAQDSHLLKTDDR